MQFDYNCSGNHYMINNQYLLLYVSYLLFAVIRRTPHEFKIACLKVIIHISKIIFVDFDIMEF